MTLVDSLCAHKNPVVAYRARRLLAGESERSPGMRTLRRAIGSSEMAKRLLLALRGERFNPYRKWQGPHWTLYSLAEIGFPAGDERLLPLRQRVMDWMFAPAFLKPPMHRVPRRPARATAALCVDGRQHHLVATGAGHRGSRSRAPSCRSPGCVPVA